MATTTQKLEAARPVVRDARVVSESMSLEFLVFEDNDGGYHWAIVGGSGESLAQSGSFGSYEEAAHAGRYARDGAEWARFECRAAEDRVVDVRARRAAARDDLDAERWLDEGGSFSSEAVTAWRAGR
ncbi:MAG: hypothetical protein E6G34_06135 [Actinobacteria bacterium]|nr:MAG: hypothetical protein E6G34_06135 [Actinomycetota bacterium]